MDEVDRQILRMLKENARASYVQIADEVGTSEGTVRARMKRLTDEGVISKFTIQTAGANIKAVIEARLETNTNTGDIARQISGWDGVERVWEVTGEQDLVVVVDVENTTQLNDVVERIRHFVEVQETRSRLVLQEH